VQIIHRNPAKEPVLLEFGVTSEQRPKNIFWVTGVRPRKSSMPAIPGTTSQGLTGRQDCVEFCVIKSHRLSSKARDGVSPASI
jgi:hypothetical protein